MKTRFVPKVITRIPLLLKRLSGIGTLVTLLTYALPADSEGAPIVGKNSPDGIWTTEQNEPPFKKGKKPEIKAKTFHASKLNFHQLKAILRKAPKEFSPEAEAKRATITVPMPDGSFARFHVVESSIMAPELAAKFPDIQTFSGQGIDDPGASIRISLTKRGFHAQILSSRGIVYVDPFEYSDPEFTISYRKQDMEQNSGAFNCLVDEPPPVATIEAETASATQTKGPIVSSLTGGSTFRVYRLAVAATGQYTAFHSSRAGRTSNVADGLAAIVVTVNRVSGIYEREMAIRLQLVGNNDQIVYANSGTDPYTEGGSSSAANQMCDDNQATIDSVIGSGNYDIGHLFAVNASSRAGASPYENGIGHVCIAGWKAKGVTGRNVNGDGSGGPVGDPYDVDYVAHEIGHQFGANHTFNCETGSCGGGTRVSLTAYEPGSGSTIMAYAGICGDTNVNDNLQPNSDAYFHFISLQNIQNYVTTGTGYGDCAATSSSGNSVPSVSAGSNYTIPGWTPFVLQATGSDLDGDTLSYCWEQRDRGVSQSLDESDNGSSPLFRSLPPTQDGKRVFPRFAEQGTNVAFGDRIPIVDRVMDFRVTARDQRAIGAFATDDVFLTVEADAGPFYIKSPSSAVMWEGGSYRGIEWAVSDTDIAPVNCSAVKILLSVDDGLTYPIELKSSTPNDGYEAAVAIPALTTNATKCRIMVKAIGNIFFDVTDEPFTITAATTPANDNKTSAQAITISANGTVSGNNLNATSEAGEPAHWHNNSGAAYTGGRSVWFSWLAVLGGTATFKLSDDSPISGVVAVYATGTDWNGLKTPALASAQEGEGATFIAEKNQVYHIAVDGLSAADVGSFTLEWSMVIDSTPPVVTFDPLIDNEAVFNFEKMGGTISEAGTVEFQIEEYNASGTNRYWTGSSWTELLNQRITATMSGTDWAPAPGILPDRGQTREGSYRLYAYAKDLAGNTALSFITVNRTPMDTTPPEVLVNILEDQVFTNNFLPPIQGIVGDLESGVDLVTAYLMRPASAGGFEYWTGNSWSSSPAELIMTYDQMVWSFAPGVGQPSGPNLRNDNYTIQVAARNREVPSNTATITVNFVVDYHPIYIWTEGSFSDSDPNNNNHLWDNPANWDQGGVPPTNAIVVINGGQPNNTSMGSINIYGVNIGGGTLTTSGMLVRKLNMTGGTLLGGTVSLEPGKGIFNWSAGYLAGTYNFPAGTVVNMTGNANKELASFAVVNNSGTVNWSGPGPLYTYAYAPGDFSRFNNLTNGVFNVLTDGAFFAATHNPSYFYNEPGALFNKVGGTGTNTVTSFYFYHRGETRVETGTIVFQGHMFLEDGCVLSGNGNTNFWFQNPIANVEARGTILLSNATFCIENGTLIGKPGSQLVTTNGGAFEWTGGTLSEEIELSAGSTMQIRGSANKTLNNFARFRNYGNITWSDSGHIYTYAYSPGDYATIENYSGSTFNVTGNAHLTFAHNPSRFIVEAGATFQKTGGGGVTHCDWSVDNNGTFECLNGTVNLHRGGSSVGKFAAGAGAFIKFTGGTHTWNNGTRLTGAGQIQIDGATVNRNGNVSSDDASLAILELITGTLGGTGNLTGNIQLNWFGGILAGTLGIAPTITVNATGPAAKELNNFAVVNNGGTFNWSGPGTLYTYAYGAPDFSTFNNLSNAVFNLKTDGELFSRTHNRSFFTNHVGGLFVKSAGAGTNAIDDFGFDNFGEIRIETGTVRLNDIAKLGIGTFVTGAGTLQIYGNVQLDTALASTATIEHINGTLTCSANAHYLGTAPYNWTGGAIEGQFKLAQGSTMNISGPPNKSINNFATFDNRGTVNWTGPGRIYTYAYQAADYATFNNYSNGVFNIKGDGTVFEIAHNRSFFTNHLGGLIVKSEGTDTNQMHSYHFINDGEVRAENGTLQFLDVMKINHGSTFNGAGTVRFAGNITLNGAMTANCAVGLDGGTFTAVVLTNGTSAYSGPGVFSWQAGTVLGHLAIQSGSTMSMFGSQRKSLQPSAVLDNHGVINWSGPGQIFTEAYSPVDASRFNNYGTLNALTDGSMFGIYQNRSWFTNHPSAVLIKSGGTNSTLLHGFGIANRGEIQTLAGTFDCSDHFEIETGSRFSGGGTILVNGGNTWLRGALEINGGIFRMSAGSLHNQQGATLTTLGNGVMEWLGGIFHGDFTLSTGSLMQMAGGTKELGNPAKLRNNGNISWIAGPIYCYSYYPGDVATIYNNSGATFDVTGDSVFNFTHYPSVFTNAPGALFRKQNSTGVTRSEWYFQNGGTLDLRSGVLELPVTPIFGESTDLQFALSGTNTATNYSRLALPSGVTLRGTMGIALSTNYTPVAGDVFTLLTYQDRSGQFTSQPMPALPYPLLWSAKYDPTAFSLSVVRAHLLEGMTTLANGEFQLNFTGPDASSAILQASTNLVDWTGILTNTPFNGSALLVDSQAANYTNRFYRVVIVP